MAGVTRPKILLVDDSELVRHVVVHALTQEGFEVTTIPDPRELADVVSRERPTLLLVDATFPDVDHDSLAALVKPHAATCTVVVFSDRPAAELADLVERMGARGAVPKDAVGNLKKSLDPFLAA